MRLGRALQQNRWAGVAEIVAVFLAAVIVVAVGWRLVSDAPLFRQAVVWVANVAMLVLVWVGLRLRGQTWASFGLSWKPGSARSLGRTFLQSIFVLVFALAAFVLGSVVMTSFGATQQSADTSGYSYLEGNLPLLVVALAAVYVVSSFGEEAIYRGFLINRLTEIGGGSTAARTISLVASAVVFGLIHFDWGLVGIVQTAFMGLALAISYLWTKRNLWALVLAHAYMDTLLLVPLYRGAG